ncbi:hypothetical protein [Sporolactobacillus terrae]|uniref:hypothetical protein n=1 Tax=Sporolactobacillus terrae TaxID=269673 RepID=UPI00111897D2|nr:hypothetical protein [Sporolactobacillus terrae]
MKFLLFFKRHWIGSLITSLSLIILIMGSYIVYLNVKPQPTAKSQPVKINTEKIAAKEDQSSDKKDQSSKKPIKKNDNAKKENKPDNKKTNVVKEKTSDKQVNNTSSSSASKENESNNDSINQTKVTKFAQASVLILQNYTDLVSDLTDITNSRFDMDADEAISRMNTWNQALDTVHESIHELSQIASDNSLPQETRNKMNEAVNEFNKMYQYNKNVFNGVSSKLNQGQSVEDSFDENLIMNNMHSSDESYKRLSPIIDEIGKSVGI